MIKPRVAFPRRHRHAGSLSLRPTGTASLLTTSGSTRRTACSGLSSARTLHTVTRSAVPRSWATAASIRTSPISALACSASSTHFPSKEPTSTSPWTWPVKRSLSLWCDGGGNKATSGWASSLLCVRCGDVSGLRERDERVQERWLLFLAAMSKLAACWLSLHLPLQTNNMINEQTWRILAEMGTLKTNTGFKRTDVF